ncbi:MAG: Rhodanese domain protein, partial [Candidatus Gallionella acididurans]
AGLFLRANGFSSVYNVTHGFEGDLNDQHRRNSLNGWRFEGLPWEQC